MKSPQSGNPRPRHFWLAPGVAINRYGFNTPGMEVVAEHLSAYKDTAHVIGINIGKNKTTSDADAPAEFAAVATRFASRGNYFVINVSSPNTPGLRALQDKGPLLQIITSVKAALAAGNSKAPLFVKIAPDMTFEAIADVISVVHESGIAGIIAANTTVSADLKAKYGEQWRNEAGGLSGDVPGFRAHVTEIIRFIRKEAGKSVTIIGAGGVKDATTVLEKIHAGASAVELVASIDEYGPSIARDTLLDIKAFLESNNTTIEQIVAAA
jgi:dihydroorotate dehydrogenase